MQSPRRKEARTARFQRGLPSGRLVGNPSIEELVTGPPAAPGSLASMKIKLYSHLGLDGRMSPTPVGRTLNAAANDRRRRPAAAMYGSLHVFDAF
jgi:hypothetical protein